MEFAMQIFLIVFSFFSIQTAIAKPIRDCSTPYAAVNTLLSNQNEGDKLSSAFCMSGFNDSLGKEQKAVQMATQQYSILG